MILRSKHQTWNGRSLKVVEQQELLSLLGSSTKERGAHLLPGLPAAAAVPHSTK